MTASLVSWRRVARNIGSLSLRELLNKGTYLFLGIVIARWMGKGALGDYTLSLLFPRIFFTIGDFGLGTWLVREVSQAREHAGRYFVSTGIFRILTSLGVVLVLNGFLFFSHYAPSLKHHIFLSTIAFFFIHLMSFVFSFFRAFERMECEFEASLVKNVLFIGGGLWAVFRNSLDLFFNVFIFSAVAAFFVSLFLYQRRIGWRDLRWEPMPLSGIFPIWLIQSVTMVYLYLGIALLSFFRDIAEVGLFQAAYSFIEVIFVLSTILTIALFPVFSRLAKHSRQHLISFYEDIFRTLLLVFVPLGILSFFGAKTLLGLFYGSSFQEALPALYLLLSGLLFFIFGGLNFHLLLAMEKEKVVLATVTGGALFHLLFNLWAIPRFGFLGASMALLTSEAIVFFVILGWIVKSFGTSSFLGRTPFFWILGIWVFSLSALGRFSFWVQLPLGLLFYGLLTLLFHRQLSRELRAVKVFWKELHETPKSPIEV